MRFHVLQEQIKMFEQAMRDADKEHSSDSTGSRRGNAAREPKAVRFANPLVDSSVACAASACPVMPIVAGPYPHRQKFISCPINALVAKLLTKKEVEQSSLAQEAMRLEYEKQRKKGTWDESRVKPWDEVRADARRRGTKAHVARVVGICSIKKT